MLYSSKSGERITDENVSICRAIMRIYSFFEINSLGMLISKDAEHILSDYIQLEPRLKDVFLQMGIQMYPTGVKSCFNNIIKIVPEVFFIYLNSPFQIPSDIICCLGNFLHTNDIIDYIEKKYHLYFSYSGRWLDRKSGAKFITDGLQVSTNIIIDFFTFSVASEDSLHHRLIHELLHVLGVEEEEMPQLILSACNISYEIAQPFIEYVMRQIQAVQDEFVYKIKTLIENEPELTQQIFQLADELVLYGLPEKVNTPLYTTTYMPSKLFPECKVVGYKVLFM